MWLYAETGQTEAISALSWNIFWLVLPSLTLFAALPWLLKQGFGFPVALFSAVVVMAGSYLLTAAIVRRFDIHI
jgi:hypothetical protein